jgi:putative transposase
LKLLKIWRLNLPRKVRKRKKNWIHNILDYLGLKSNLLRTLLLKGNKIDHFKVILSDFTEIYYSDNKCYLCVHLDYSGKYILGWEASITADQEFVISSGKKAMRCLKKFKVNDFSKIIFHQDRGSVYTSEGYVSLLLNNQIQISYSRKGEPGDNAVNESFFSRLKDEWKDIFFELKEFSEVKNEIKKVIEYYNKKRYHTSIGFKTPLAHILDRMDT